MPKFRYNIDGAWGTIEAEDIAEADMMIREEIEIRIELDINEDDPRKDR